MIVIHRSILQASSMASDHAIEIREETGPAHWKECCIYKVPESLRKVNPKAYTPKLVSIGPIHNGLPELEKMEQEKQRYSEFFWRRITFSNVWKGEYEKYLRDDEKNIRLCYSEEFADPIRDRFVDTILLDTVFIMELFLRKLETDKHEHDYLYNKLWINKGIEQDLLLLENQVPISTLKYLYEKFVPRKPADYPTFLDLARKYFESYDPQISTKKQIELKKWESSKHFTDLIRYLHIPLDLSFEDNSVPVQTATKLQEAGVSFEAVDGKCLLAIKFKQSWLNWFLCLGCFYCSKCVKPRLKLPQLKVDGRTEVVLRNLIALEQCHYPRQHYVCSYISLLDYLIHGKEDVELLVEKGVIVHQLSTNDEVASMINGLGKETFLKGTCYGKTIDDLNKHYEHCWKKFMGVIKWVYFRDPWRSSTTVVAVLLLLLTIVNYLRGFSLIHIKS